MCRVDREDISATYLKIKVADYYPSMEWDKKIGKPRRPTLKRFAMDDVAKDLSEEILQKVAHAK